MYNISWQWVGKVGGMLGNVTTANEPQQTEQSIRHYNTILHMNNNNWVVYKRRSTHDGRKVTQQDTEYC